MHTNSKDNNQNLQLLPAEKNLPNVDDMTTKTGWDWFCMREQDQAALNR